MKLDLNNYVQDKKTVAEYEIGFNHIFCFVPHVAHDEVEKARQFRQGLKPAIRHVLGAFSITNFRSMVEQALGVEMQIMYTTDLYKSFGGEQSRSQGDRKGHSGGPSHKKGKSQHHHAYCGSSTQSRTSGGTTPQYRAIPKPDDGSASFFSRARAAYTSIPVATFRYSTGPYTSVRGLLVAPRHYFFNTRGSLGSCTGCSYCGSLFFD
ncbi:hypothetical protein E2562_032615 [Oryza meyeriana var. granulata]|uniref:Retrotransposon gag domain-containing protein n=1 Tax=Oryza meyeriana var. granulata TaxID=110450 RepID=A0A6G1D9X8_9ORYZ|nr:hypothetical protein E2562_032615 [Oryza meyeriana var. granulata]